MPNVIKPIETFRLIATGTGIWDAVTLSYPQTSVAIQARSSVDVKVSENKNTSTFWTIKSGTTLTITTGNLASTVLYFEAAAATVIEFIIVKANHS